jgi:hypothetical protein
MRPRHSIRQKPFLRSLSTVFQQVINRVGFFTSFALLTSFVTSPQEARGNYQSSVPVGTIQLPSQHSSKAKEAPSDVNSAGAFDIAELVRQVENNGAAMHKRMREYTYLLKKTRRILNEQGKASSVYVQGFEAYPVRGEHVLIQLTRNGLPLAPWEVEAERKRAGERLEKFEQEENHSEAGNKQRAEGYVAAGVYGRAQGRPVALSVDLAAFLHWSEFYSPQFERVGDRGMIVLRFRPRPGVNLPRNKSFVAKLVGTVWIDSADKVIARFEGWPAPEFVKRDEAQAASQPEARLIYRQVKLPDGMWFPNLIRVNSAGDGSLFDGLNWDVLFEFSEYKHFTTTVEEIKIQDPKKQN